MFFIVFIFLIDNKPASLQIMALRRTGDKPLSEPLMHIMLMIQVTVGRRLNFQSGISSNGCLVACPHSQKKTTISGLYHDYFGEN